MITVGIDEVGRGPWAGPVVAAAVILRKPIAGLNDSKKLSKKQRQSLLEQIEQHARYGIGWVMPADIDKRGITWSVKRAMELAVEALGLAQYDTIIIDGNINYLPENPKAQAIIKADASEPAVSAASIVAKEARDAYMCTLAEKFPNYGFDKHVGYGTTLHRAALAEYGITEHHRKSFKPIREFLSL